MLRFQKTEHIGCQALRCSKKTVDNPIITHFHDFFELEYVVSGHGTYIVDGVEYPIRHGMLFFMSPLNFHSLKNEAVELYNLMFSFNAADGATLSRALGSNVYDLDGADDRFIERLLDELSRAATDDYSSLLLNTLLYKLSTLNDTKASPSPLNGTLAYILDNFRGTLTLADAAKNAGFSANYFSALFKRTMGTGFKQYLDGIRLEYARKLIVHTDRSISEICRMSGFDDYANFVRRTKKYLGMTASQLRTRNRKH